MDQANNALVLTSLLLSIMTQGAKIAAMLKQAQSENRDITAEELAELASEDDVARKALDDAIAAKK